MTIREVCDSLPRQGYFAYRGVLNCMNRLVQKGILEREETNVAYQYRLLVELEDLTTQVLDNVLGHMGGAPELARLRDKLRAPTRPRRR